PTVDLPSTMDAIFCRNVLMYFSPVQARRVMQQFYHTLVEGGWLFVSPNEISHLPCEGFRLVNFPDLTVYQKDSTTSRLVQRHQAYDGVLHQRSVLSLPPGEAKATSPQHQPVLPEAENAPAIPLQPSPSAAVPGLDQQERSAETMALLARAYA